MRIIIDTDVLIEQGFEDIIEILETYGEEVDD